MKITNRLLVAILMALPSAAMAKEIQFQCKGTLGTTSFDTTITLTNDDNSDSTYWARIAEESHYCGTSALYFVLENENEVSLHHGGSQGCSYSSGYDEQISTLKIQDELSARGEIHTIRYDFNCRLISSK